MKVEELKKYFDEAKSNSIRFAGKCHDCSEAINVDIDQTDKELVVIGGAVYKPDDRVFLKCDKCFKKDSTLKDFRECEMYSRVVGYLRPVKQWNPGKKAEYNDRKKFKTNTAGG